MKYLVLMLVGISACGVNPERANEMNRKQKSAGSTTELTVDESDPAEIRGAIDALERAKASIESKDWGAYRANRYEVARPIVYSAMETVATHPKTPAIIQNLQSLDVMAAERIGNDGAVLADPLREMSASAEAVYTFASAAEQCRAGLASAQTAEAVAEVRSQFETSLQKAQNIDPRVARFAGRSPNNSGFIDVAVETAVCRALVGQTAANLADAPPTASDKSAMYAGCGYYDIPVVANQKPNGGFDAFNVPDAMKVEPGTGTVAACEKIPPLSDAPDDVQRVLTEQVTWLQPTDIVSMAGGAFSYEDGDEGMMKKGTARIYRRQAQLSTNRCGARDVNVTCAADGDPLTLKFDHGKHFLNRASAYRSKGDAEGCLKMAKQAQSVTADVPATGDPIKIFQVADNRRLTFTNIKVEIEAIHSEAAEMVNSNWCSAAP